MKPKPLSYSPSLGWITARLTLVSGHTLDTDALKRFVSAGKPDLHEFGPIGISVRSASVIYRLKRAEAIPAN